MADIVEKTSERIGEGGYCFVKRDAMPFVVPRGFA
jgi:hypothetical protein